MFRLVVICGCLLAVARAGVIGGGLLAATAPTASVALHPAVALPTVATSSSSSNIIRGIGNLGTISAYSKSVDTAFSSVRKADVRVNNPGVTRIVAATTVPAVAVTNTALAGAALPLTTAVAAAPTAITTGLAAPSIATSALGLNGLALNGLGVNALGVNALGLNGLGVNGLGVNGLGVNGLGVNGLGVNGLGVNGLGVNGLGLNGLGLNGLGLGAVKVHL